METFLRLLLHTVAFAFAQRRRLLGPNCLSKSNILLASSSLGLGVFGLSAENLPISRHDFTHWLPFSSQSAWFVSAQWQPLFNIRVNAVARTTLTVLTPNPNTTSLYIPKNSRLMFHSSNRSTDIYRLFGLTYCREDLLSLTRTRTVGCLHVFSRYIESVVNCGIFPYVGASSFRCNKN